MHSSMTVFQTVPVSLAGCTRPPDSSAILAYSFPIRPSLSMSSAIRSSISPSAMFLPDLMRLFFPNSEPRTLPQEVLPYGPT